MSTEVPELVETAESVGDAPRRRRRTRNAAHSILAHNEPMVWLTGAGLVICLVMVLSLLLLVVSKGSATFWPSALVQVTTVNGKTHLGEVTRESTFMLSFQSLGGMEDASREQATKILHPLYRERVMDLVEADRLQSYLEGLLDNTKAAIRISVAQNPTVRDATASERHALLEAVDSAMETESERLTTATARAVEATLADESGDELQALREQYRQTQADWRALSDVAAMQAEFTPELLESIWGAQLLSLLSYEIQYPMDRRLIRTGNFELTGEHFNWVSDFEVVDDGETKPDWAVLFERLSWGRFYGIPQSLTADGEVVATGPEEVWTSFQKYHPEARDRWHQRRRLEIVDIGRINHALEAARLALKDVELAHGRDSSQWQAANDKFTQDKEVLDAEFDQIRKEIQRIDAENEKFQVLVKTSDGQETSLQLAEIVRAFPANQLSTVERIGVYLSRWREFLLDDPREANSEGGV
ncbi:MAG: phosphate ABC transporter, permease protein PstA, partial [Pirellulales bacterium]